MLVDNVLEKTPGDALLRLAMDFAALPEITGGATIASVTSILATPAGLTIASQQVDSGSHSASATFVGGVDGQDYLVTFTVLLSSGQTLQRTGKLRVRVQ